MRKVIAMGETILDILFRNNQPQAAIPGGSCFNSIISVARCGLPCAFVGYVGDDYVGQIIVDFLKENHVSCEYLEVHPNENNAVSLAFLDNQSDAHYVFHKPKPNFDMPFKLPTFNKDDILLLSSYYALRADVRSRVRSMLDAANQNDAIVYYDLNFRPSHRDELDALRPVLEENCRKSSIVRGSTDDLQTVFGSNDAEKVYATHMSRLCKVLICTAGASKVQVCTPHHTYQFDVPRLDHVVSTVGAGDTFNAGFNCALLHSGITHAQLDGLSESSWHDIIKTACAFAAQACMSTENYISAEYGRQLGYAPM